MAGELGAFVRLAKAAGRATGGLALAGYGVWGGQYAARFPPAYQRYAAILRLVAMGLGIIFAAIAILLDLRPSTAVSP